MTKFCSVRETTVQSTLADYYSITSLICNYYDRTSVTFFIVDL